MNVSQAVCLCRYGWKVAQRCVRFRGKTDKCSFSWNLVCVKRLSCVHKIKWTHLAASPEPIVLTDLMSCGSDLVLL